MSSTKYKKRRWHILRNGKYFTGKNFLSKGLAQAFLRSIGVNPGDYDYEKIRQPR